MDSKIIIRELDELDRVVHRLRTRLAISTSQRIAHTRSQNAWSATHGAIGLERGITMMKHIAQSRRKDAQRFGALLSLSKRHK